MKPAALVQELARLSREGETREERLAASDNLLAADCPLALPKPPKRGRKPQRRIQRTAPIQRSSKPPKRARIKKPKALSRRWLQRLADDLSSLKTRSRGRCEKRCEGKPMAVPDLQNSHGIGRSYLATRYDQGNLFASCFGCHKYFTDRPFEFHDFLVARWGQDGFDRVWSKALEGVRLGYAPDYEDLIDRLWRDEDVQRALLECSENRQREIQRDVKKLRQHTEKLAAFNARKEP